MKNKIVIAISGASGVIYGIRAIEILKQDSGTETHLIISSVAEAVIATETNWKVSDVKSLADKSYDEENVGASIASGSFLTDGMLVAPCSIKTLSAIANSYNANLIARAADVQLKEGRTVVLMVRETPLHIGHLRLMQKAFDNGAVVFPPVPAFYNHPNSVDDIVNETVGRALFRLGISNAQYYKWAGLEEDLG